jgi:hypothetical protein
MVKATAEQKAKESAVSKEQKNDENKIESK